MTTDGNISEVSKIEFHGSNRKSFQIQAILISNIHNDTFQNFVQLPLQAFILYVLNYPRSTYVVEKGAFAGLSNVTQMNIFTETFPVLGSLNQTCQL